MDDGSCRGGEGYAACSDDQGSTGTVRFLLSTLLTLDPLIVSRTHTDDRSDISSSSEEEEASDPSDTVLVRAASRMRETPRARLRRLTYEMTQLERELQAEEPTPPGGGGGGGGGTSRKTTPDSRDALRQLAELRDRAERVQARVRPVSVPGRAGQFVKEVVQGPATTTSGEEKTRGEEPVVSSDARGSAHVAELDRRLHVLERRIGTGTIDEVGPHLPLFFLAKRTHTEHERTRFRRHTSPTRSSPPSVNRPPFNPSSSTLPPSTSPPAAPRCSSRTLRVRVPPRGNSR